MWWPSLTKDMQTEQLLCWNGMTDTEHCTAGSNEVSKKEILQDANFYFSGLIYCET